MKPVDRPGARAGWMAAAGCALVAGAVVLIIIATTSHRSRRDAMLKQCTAATTAEEDAEYAAWERIRDAAAADMLGRHREEG
jgi:hypothetical protein